VGQGLCPLVELVALRLGAAQAQAIRGLPLAAAAAAQELRKQEVTKPVVWVRLVRW
jgi:hypothetical protein